MNPLISIFRARTAHFQLQVLLTAQMNTKIMGGLIEQSVIQGTIDVLHDKINLMKRILDAHELGLKFMINSCYYTSMSPVIVFSPSMLKAIIFDRQCVYRASRMRQIMAIMFSAI